MSPQSTSPSMSSLAAFPSHIMVTCRQDDTSRRSLCTNGTIRYSLPRALLAYFHFLLMSRSVMLRLFVFPNDNKVWSVSSMLAEEWHMDSSFSSRSIFCELQINTFLKFKRKADGSIECHKTLLVAKDFHWQANVNFDEIFSSVTKLIIICAILDLVLPFAWSIGQLDENNAFFIIF